MILKEMNFRKELTEGVHSVFFTYRQYVGLPADDVFADLEQSLIDAEKSWIWPDQFSVHVPDSTPLREGVTFVTKYKMPDSSSGGVAKYEYRYKLVRFDRESRCFEYRAEPGHPFPGGGGVATVFPEGPDGCIFEWDGCYSHTGNRSAAEETFSWYFSTFFGAVEKNILAHVASLADQTGSESGS